MFNYHFKTYNEYSDKDVYVMADDYNSSLNILFNRFSFNNYQFVGVEGNN